MISPIHAITLQLTTHTQHTHTLTQNGGDVNILDGDKRTPIYYARRHGHQEAVQILIANSCVDDSSDSGSIDAAQQS